MRKLFFILLAVSLVGGCVPEKSIPDGIKKIYFFKGGPLKAEYTYKNNMKNGPAWTYYKVSNQIRTESNYKNDKLDGNVKRYSQRGQLIGTAVFKDGVMVSEKRLI